MKPLKDAHRAMKPPLRYMRSSHAQRIQRAAATSDRKQHPDQRDVRSSFDRLCRSAANTVQLMTDLAHGYHRSEYHKVIRKACRTVFYCETFANRTLTPSGGVGSALATFKRCRRPSSSQPGC